MILRSALCCAAVLAMTSHGWAAEKTTSKKPAKAPTKAAAKPAAKTAAKPSQKPIAKASGKPTARTTPKPSQKTAAGTRGKAGASALVNTSLDRSPAPAAAPAAPALRGKTEVLTCREGTEDRHARIAVVLIGGKTDSFAYYSKWKPRTCSIYLQRNRDAYSKWSDSGSVTNVSTDRGAFQIEHKAGEYRIAFRDVDRERYCGMDGTINGTLTIRKGSASCELAGIMEEGIPLGQAYAHLEQGAAATTQTALADDAPVRTAGASTSHTSPFQRIVQWFRRHSVPPRADSFPSNAGASDRSPPSAAASAAVGLSD